MTPAEFTKLSPDDKVDYIATVDGYRFAPIPKSIGQFMYDRLSEEKKLKFKFDKAGNRWRRHIK